MPPKATRRSVKKSRGGCARCKSQHLKCDENRPACGRCERLSVSCPGYSQPLKWSTKHEVSQSQWVSENQLSRLDSPAEDAFSPEQAMNDFDWLEFPLPAASPAVATQAGQATRLEDMPAPSSIAPSLVEQFAWPPLEALFGDNDASTNTLQLVQQKPRNERRQSMLQSLGARMSCPQIQRSLGHQPYELLSYYFKTIPALYSTFDSHKNPFRSSVSKLFGHSLAVNLAAQSMAAACLVEIHPRFASLGYKLRRDALEAVKNEPNHNYDVLLALSMSGPTGNWFQSDDLGIASYNAMRDRLEALAAGGASDDAFNFFSEAMVHWEMALAWGSEPGVIRPSLQLHPRDLQSSKYEAHPWTGVSRDIVEVVRDIGKLVRANRLRSNRQRFVCQATIHQMTADLASARELERRLLAVTNPLEDEIENPGDEATPVWHLTTLGELHRYAGLLQLYRVFPDLLSERLRNESSVDMNSLLHFGNGEVVLPEKSRGEWLTSFAMEALRLMEQIPVESSTKDFQPFLLVTFASELVCENMAGQEEDMMPDFALTTNETTISRPFAEVALMRKFVQDRLTAFLSVIPPKPIRVCLDIVRETWRRIDEGQQYVYWLDVMIENGWETILA